MNEFESIYEPKEHFNYLKFIKDHNFYDYIEDSPRGAIAFHSVNAAYQMYINRQDKIDELAKHVACIKTIVSECDENTDSSWIIGNIDGFIECMEKILNDQSN